MSAENAQQWLQEHPQQIPVLANNRQEIDRLLKIGQHSPSIVNLASNDPGLCLALLVKVNGKRGEKTSKDIIESPKAAIALLGDQVFLNLLKEFPVAETTLKNSDQLFLFQQLINRSLHNAFQAEAWAVKLGFHNIELIRLSALLSYCGELLCCLYDFNTYRQYIVSGSNDEYCEKLFGFEFSEITESLVHTSHLPDFILQSLDQKNSNGQSVTLLNFTSRVCHQCEFGWYNSSLNQLFEQFSEWLQLPLDNVSSKCEQISVEAARQSPVTNAWQPAARLILQQDKVWSELNTRVEQRKPVLTRAQKPRPDKKDETSIQEILKRLNQLVHQTTTTKSELLSASLKSLFQDLNMSRVALFLLTADKKVLNNRMSLGIPKESSLYQCSIDVGSTGLFKVLLNKPQAILINSNNIEKYQTLIPQTLNTLLSTDTFIAMSLFIGEKPMGIIYADRTDSEIDIHAEEFVNFKKLISFSSKALTLLSKR